MPLPAFAAVAGLVAAAHLGRRGSATDLSKEDKKRIVDLVKQGLVTDAWSLATELGFDTLDLSGADLQRAYLTDTGLSGANLSKTNSYFANLSHANLTGANLRSANMNVANLTNANLTGADLTGADLTSASLIDANLTGADLSNANLDGAFILGATGINTGPARTFIGIPNGYIEARSPFVPGRTTLRRTE